MAGIKAAWKNEQAFRWEAIIVLLMMPVGLWLGRTAVERALLIASSMSILIIELLNSAVEAVVDRIGPERHELSKRAKDLGSAAAFISMITAAVVWGLIAYERFLG
jgi:diacylglycerol kinase (ATP)